jgi:hypothetical protein
MPRKAIRQPSVLERFRRWVFLPPYSGVPWLVCLYVLICCVIYTGNGPFTGHVIGFDDQVRMTQVLNLVNGAGWYDRTIMRVNAPEGFETLWARIVDIPLALTVIVGQQFTDQRTAALAAVVIVPMAELIILFYVARYFARPLAGKKEAWLVILFLMFTTVLNQKRHTLAGFHIGEASHHSWYVILNLLMMGASARVMLNVRGKSPVLFAGVAIGLLLAVGIEGFPLIAGTAAIMTILAWWFDNPALARRGAKAFGVGAALGLLLLPMHLPPARWFDVSFSQPSILGPVLVAAAAMFLTLESGILQWLGKRHKALSFICVIAGAAIFGALIVCAFPKILEGPAAALSPMERQLAHNEHPEAWPMYREAINTFEYITWAMPTFIAIGAGLFAMWIARSRRRRLLYAAYFGFAALAGGMAQVFWRYVHHAMPTACAWLLWSWQKIRQRLTKNKYHALGAFAAFIALGPLWMLILPALQFDAPILSQVILYPAKIYSVQNSWDSCDVLPFADYLDAHYGKETKIEVPDWDSANFLYNTHLKIDFLSNYPSHDKFIDNRIFFDTQNMDQARDVAARHGFNLVALCLIIPMSAEAMQSRPRRAPMLIETLREGHPPPWLKPIDTEASGLYRLFAVDKAAVAGNKAGNQ